MFYPLVWIAVQWVINFYIEVRPLNKYTLEG
jgi:hypothetical protein